MWCHRRTGKAVWETRRPFSLSRSKLHVIRAAARPIISPRRACAGAIRSFIMARISAGAVSGEPALNGGEGLYSSRSWIASAVRRSTAPPHGWHRDNAPHRHCEEHQRRSNPLFPCCFGLLRGACHPARIRAIRWLAMTTTEKGRPVSQTAFPVLRWHHIHGRFQDICARGLLQAGS